MKKISSRIELFRIITSAMMIAIVISAVVNPLPVKATCITVGDVTTCDADNDFASGDSANADNEVVTNSISGGDGYDLILGGNANGNNSSVTDTLEGGGGNDTIVAGNAFGYGATIDATLDGGDGDDLIAGASAWGGNTSVTNTINGGEGDDWIHPGGDPGTTNIVDGGNGTDTLDYSYMFSSGTGPGVTVDLTNTSPQQVSPDQSTDTILNVENLFGTARDDTLTGDSGANKLTGAWGNDTLDGNGGDDEAFGGEGDDSLSGQDGQFYLFGEGGNDTLVMSGELQTAAVDGGSGQNIFQFLANTFGYVTLTTTSDEDTLDFSQYDQEVTIDLLNTTTAQKVGGQSGNELWVTLNGLFKNVFGAIGFSNFITGNSLDNTLTGGDQDDSLNGGGGNNSLYGGLGTDTDTAATPVSGGVINQSGTWFSIELPQALPVGGGDPTGTTTLTLSEALGNGGPGFVPVTGGLTKLTCGENTFELPNGDSVSVSGICGDYWVSIEPQSETPSVEMPAGTFFLSGIKIQIFQGDDVANLEKVDPLPQGASILFSFLLQDPDLVIQPHLLGDGGGWLELANGQISGQRYSVSTQQSGTAILTTN
ncbi:MAG: calcium-binding protein [Anaerolineaceae bacterium]